LAKGSFSDFYRYDPGEEGPVVCITKYMVHNWQTHQWLEYVPSAVACKSSKSTGSSCQVKLLISAWKVYWCHSRKQDWLKWRPYKARFLVSATRHITSLISHCVDSHASSISQITVLYCVSDIRVWGTQFAWMAVAGITNWHLTSRSFLIMTLKLWLKCPSYCIIMSPKTLWLVRWCVDRLCITSCLHSEAYWLLTILFFRSPTYLLLCSVVSK